MASPSPEIQAPEPPDSSADESAAPADASSLWLVLARDLAIVAAVLSLFAAADAWHALTGTALSARLSLIDGLLVGALLGGLFHEWGHFTGARLYRSRAPLRPVAGFLPLFDFDYLGNTREQFQGMSIGGNVAHWLVVIVLLLGLPLSSIGQVALASGAIGFAIFASSVEFPIILHAYRGSSGIEALSKLPKDFVRRNGSYGVVAALLALFVL